MASAIRCTVDLDGVATILIDQPERKINVLDADLISELEHVVSELRRDLKGIILASGKEGQFIAGADLEQILAVERPEQIGGMLRRFQRTLNALAEHPAPSVAAINGAALGGGFEVVLACDYRVCADLDGNILGLPEVQLGLVPAGGGCQRLPALTGLSRSLGLILQGKRFSPKRAKGYGAVDEVVHPRVLQESATSWLARGKRQAHPKWDLLDAAADRSTAVRRFIYRQAETAALKETRGHYPAPLKALDAIRVGREQGMGAGLAAEAVAFGELTTSPVAKNLIGLFFATEALKKEQRAMSEPASGLNRVGVVGAGFMGAGIAQAAAVGGAAVRIRDIEAKAVARGLKTARDLTISAGRKGRFSRPQAAEIASRLSGSTDYSGFARAQLVIEAVFEDLEVKRQVIADLENTLAPGAIIASNTSALPITLLAEQAMHPERIVGMHFFSPVHKMPLLEVVRAERTSDIAIATAVGAGRAMGKTVIVVNDGPGFYTTRVLGLMMQEAGALFEAGASIRDIDRAMTGFGFPVGPMALTDEVGIDVAAHIGRFLHESLPERFVPPTAIERLVADGRLGRKNGRGFYDYSGKKKRPDDTVDGLRSAAPANFPAGLIQRRLALALINEAAHCLQEGILSSPRDGDVGAVLGFGFPPFLGGPFRYAESQGMENIVHELRQMEYAYGPAFKPAEIIATRELSYA
jgi:3-hydroxyacyl-CoA dehydrogenase/enoyl-CoA hydratase/3-hydroxybutyryl-CoA epimerase